MSRLLLLAASATPSPSPTLSGEGQKSGPWGFLIILLLCVAAYFLMRSMSRHMRKVRTGFPSGGKRTDDVPVPVAADAQPAAELSPPDTGESTPARPPS